MNEQDKAAFEKWLNDRKAPATFEEAWQAALEYERGDYRQDELRKQLHDYFNQLEQERERSRRLIEALENCLKIFSLSGSARTILNKALREYRGEK